jgi:hypothetical protein
MKKTIINVTYTDRTEDYFSVVDAEKIKYEDNFIAFCSEDEDGTAFVVLSLQNIYKLEVYSEEQEDD